MKQNNHLNLVAGIFTLALLVLVIFVFFAVKNRATSPKSELEIKDQEIEEANFDITFISPQKVFDIIRKDDFLIIDTRSELEFRENHIESSINIPLENLENNPKLPKDKTLVFVEGMETITGKQMASDLKDLGYQLNYLEGGLIDYLNAGFNLISSGDLTSLQDRAKTNPVDLKSLGERLEKGERFIYLDVREEKDYNQNHFEKSVNIPLEKLEEDKEKIPTGKILIFDEDPIRSFKASVRLTDMNILSNYYLSDSYSELKDAIQNRTLAEE